MDYFLKQARCNPPIPCYTPIRYKGKVAAKPINALIII